MQFNDTSRSFGFTSILLHWVSAVLIAVLFVMGQIMEDMSRGPDKADLMAVHQSLGMLLLILVLARLLWRLGQGFPAAPGDAGSLANRVSRLWHWLLLIVIIAIPASGYMVSETATQGISFFGMFALPDLMGANHDLHEVFEEIHETMSKLLIPLVIVHVLAAFKHHYFDRDDTLKRMMGPGKAA